MGIHASVVEDQIGAHLAEQIGQHRRHRRQVGAILHAVWKREIAVALALAQGEVALGVGG